MTQKHPLSHLEAVLIVGVGGFAGSNLRYFVELLVPVTPVATVTVNVLGCFALGFFLYEDIYGGTITKPSRTVLATGFISSFTTYSTFVVDAVTSEPAAGIAYVGISYAVGFGSVLVGRELARLVTSLAPPLEESA
jgi:CrcB protein